MSLKSGSHTSHGWAFWMNGPDSGVLSCDTPTKTFCSGVSSLSASRQQSESEKRPKRGEVHVGFGGQQRPHHIHVCDAPKNKCPDLPLAQGSQQAQCRSWASSSHRKEKEWVAGMTVVHGEGSRGEVSSSLLHGAGPWRLVPGGLCAEGWVQTQENLTAVSSCFLRAV